MTSVSVLVAIGVAEDGYREILGACEGASESKECWRSFLVILHHGDFVAKFSKIGGVFKSCFLLTKN